MPLYEYECEDGHRFERLMQMQDRHNVVCPECMKPATQIMSLIRHRIASPLPVYLHDGTKIHEFRDAPSIRPPTPPEELVRVGELSNIGDRGLR